MANKAVSLVRICKTESGWKRYPVVMSANGRVKPNAVLVDGVEMAFPEGRYLLRSYVGKQPKYTPAGSNPADALAVLRRAQRTVHVRTMAKEAGIKLAPDAEGETDGRKMLDKAFRSFHAATIDRGSLVAAKHYRQAVDDFLAHSGLVYAEDMATEHVSRWIGDMRKRGHLSDRSIFNHYCSLRAFLIHLKIADRLPRSPRYEKKLPEVYTKGEIEAFFAAVKGEQYQTVTYSIALMCGLRERELMHLEWQDVDWKQKTLRVRGKPQWGFAVKDKEERDVPIPASLLTMLRKWQKKRPDHKLITGTSTDKPNGKLLRTLKRIVYATELNCGTCEGCRSKWHECEHWWLHKFRSTYITSLLRAGIDLRTVMSLSGHSDLASVMRYLRPAEGASLQGRIDSVFG